MKAPYTPPTNCSDQTAEDMGRRCGRAPSARAALLQPCAALAILCCIGGCAALTFELPSNGVQKCFYENAKKEVVMEARFQVIGKDFDDVPTVDAEVRSHERCPAAPPRCVRAAIPTVAPRLSPRLLALLPQVKMPNGKQLLKEMKKTRGHLDFVPDFDGVHAFCFRQHTRGKQATLRFGSFSAAFLSIFSPLLGRFLVSFSG